MIHYKINSLREYYTLYTTIFTTIKSYSLKKYKIHSSNMLDGSDSYSPPSAPEEQCMEHGKFVSLC
jgi:hypothetical protein